MLVKHCGMRCYWKKFYIVRKSFVSVSYITKIVSQQLGFGDFSLLQGSS